MGLTLFDEWLKRDQSNGQMTIFGMEGLYFVNGGGEGTKKVKCTNKARS